MTLRVLLSLCLFALVSLAGDLNGKWVAKVQGPNGELEVTYSLKVDEAGKISGTANSHMGEMKISDGKLSGDDVIFQLEAEMNGETRKFEHKGKLSGDDLKMTLEFNGQAIEINAKRSAS